MNVRPGDMAEIIKVSKWGGRSPTGVTCLVLKRCYTGYETKDSKWKVMLGGKVKIFKENILRPVWVKKK